MQTIALLSLLLAPAQAFVAGPVAARSLQMRPAAVAQPQMVLPGAAALLPDTAAALLALQLPVLACAEAAPLVNDAIMLLAKSEADELLEDFFINFPLFFSGGVLGFFAGQVAIKNGFDENLAKAAIPAFAVVAIIGGNTGILQSGSGLVMKVAFDAWNLFAGVALPGALLKY